MNALTRQVDGLLAAMFTLMCVAMTTSLVFTALWLREARRVDQLCPRIFAGVSPRMADTLHIQFPYCRRTP